MEKKNNFSSKKQNSIIEDISIEKTQQINGNFDFNKILSLIKVEPTSIAQETNICDRNEKQQPEKVNLLIDQIVNDNKNKKISEEIKNNKLSSCESLIDDVHVIKKLNNINLIKENYRNTTITTDNLIDFNALPFFNEQQPYTIKYIIENGKNIKIWECRLCEIQFQLEFALVQHLILHTNERNYFCNECGKGFRELTTLNQHQAIHKTDRPFNCKNCPKSFNRISSLISHRKTHLENKQYQCFVCMKSFHQKGNLKNHMFIHSDERPYKCTYCPKGFNQMSNLTCHKQKMHSNVIDKIWGCYRCPLTFSKRNILRKHELEVHQIKQQRIPKTTMTTKRKLSFPSPFNNKSKITKKQLPIAAQRTQSQINNTNNNNNTNANQSIIESGLFIPLITTDAIKIAKNKNEMPFAVLHFLEGIPILVRCIEFDDKQHLLRVANKTDFIALKLQQQQYQEQQHQQISNKISIPIVASIYQRLSENGVPEFYVQPPRNIYELTKNDKNILNEPSVASPATKKPINIFDTLKKDDNESDKKIIKKNKNSKTSVYNSKKKSVINKVSYNSDSVKNNLPKVITISSDTERDQLNWWNDGDNNSKMEISETFTNIATGNFLSPKKEKFDISLNDEINITTNSTISILNNKNINNNNNNSDNTTIFQNPSIFTDGTLIPSDGTNNTSFDYNNDNKNIVHKFDINNISDFNNIDNNNNNIDNNNINITTLDSTKFDKDSFYALVSAIHNGGLVPNLDVIKRFVSENVINE